MTKGGWNPRVDQVTKGGWNPRVDQVTKGGWNPRVDQVTKGGWNLGVDQNLHQLHWSTDLEMKSSDDKIRAYCFSCEQYNTH